ncbi:uncharacterized protein LOC124889133 [Capsicum annuum]|uniref:uncharacterized protein LOC124889133 n=1 Tax=Capsicum annuum TaxID=4072 RepID=UPI001FB0BFF9|nr:uncharacterized protein LOC124889133 [Capsicum annuum]
MDGGTVWIIIFVDRITTKVIFVGFADGAPMLSWRRYDCWLGFTGHGWSKIVVDDLPVVRCWLSGDRFSVTASTSSPEEEVAAAIVARRRIGVPIWVSPVLMAVQRLWV